MCTSWSFKYESSLPFLSMTPWSWGRFETHKFKQLNSLLSVHRAWSLISYILPTHAPCIIKTLYKHIKISSIKTIQMTTPLCSLRFKSQIEPDMFRSTGDNHQEYTMLLSTVTLQPHILLSPLVCGSILSVLYKE